MRAISIIALSCILAATSPATANPLATDLSPPDSSTVAPPFSYPESAENGWPKSCESDPAATDPSNPPPDGPQQSPIDFTRLTPVSTTIPVGVLVKGTYNEAENNVVFPVPMIAVDFMNEKLTYSPVSFHFHFPNEHVVKANTAMLELHIKAKDQNQHYGVFAILFEPSLRHNTPRNPLLNQVIANLMAPGTMSGQVDLVPALNKFMTRHFYAYVGSLTTPQCNTGINWYVLQTPELAPASQISAVVKALQGAKMPRSNNRTPRQLTTPPPTVYLSNQ